MNAGATVFGSPPPEQPESQAGPSPARHTQRVDNDVGPPSGQRQAKKQKNAVQRENTEQRADTPMTGNAIPVPETPGMPSRVPDTPLLPQSLGERLEGAATPEADDAATTPQVQPVTHECSPEHFDIATPEPTTTQQTTTPGEHDDVLEALVREAGLEPIAEQPRARSRSPPERDESFEQRWATMTRMRRNWSDEWFGRRRRHRQRHRYVPAVSSSSGQPWTAARHSSSGAELDHHRRLQNNVHGWMPQRRRLFEGSRFRS